MARRDDDDREHYHYYVERTPDGDVSSLMRVLAGEDATGEAWIEGAWVEDADVSSFLVHPPSRFEAVDADEIAHIIRELDVRDELRSARDEAVDLDEVAHHLRDLQPPSEPDT